MTFKSNGNLAEQTVTWEPTMFYMSNEDSKFTLQVVFTPMSHKFAVSFF